MGRGESRQQRQQREALLARDCQLHRQGAWSALIAHFERPLLYFLAQSLPPEDALDALQEVWTSAYKSIGSLDDPEALRAWLYRLARRRVVDKQRLQGRIEKTREAIERETIPEEEEPLGLVLHFFEELSTAEVAAVLGVPRGTVKSRIYHAKKGLRQRLEGMEGDTR